MTERRPRPRITNNRELLGSSNATRAYCAREVRRHTNANAVRRSERGDFVRIWVLNGWETISRAQYEERKASFRGWENIEEC